jgi:hypothetical protein
MKEINQQTQDKIQNIKQVSIEKKTVHIGTLKPKKGHKMFEVNMKLKTIKEATFDNPPAIKFTDAQIGVKSVKKKITITPDCVYISALNKKNVQKILKRDFGAKF